MAIELDISDLTSDARIRGVGVGGGGGNAVRTMITRGLDAVEFIAANTDRQALMTNPAGIKLQLGKDVTRGLGAGADPNRGRMAVEESIDDVRDALAGSDMVFVTAGMGGGTGTGAAPIVAKISKENGILTVGIVTIPFEDEGPDRIGQAMKGVEALKPHVDALLTISNDRIVDMYGDLPITKAFSKADDILCTAAKGIAEIITKAGMLNVDFKDVQTAMTNSGRAIMGTGVAKGNDRAEQAVQMALDSPLLDNTRIHGAKHVLVNFTYGAAEPTLGETSKVKKFLQQEAGHTAHLKMGITQDPRLGEEIAITVIATGFEASGIVETPQVKEVQNTVVETLQEAFPTPAIFTPEPADIFGQKDGPFNDGMGNPGDKRLNREKDADNLNVPAYLRRGVVLNTTPASDSNHISRHQISEATEESEQQVPKNKFLHDNVD